MDSRYRLLWIVFGLSLCSCQSVLLKIYGIKNLNTLNEDLIVKTARKYKIPEQQSYVLDSLFYKKIEEYRASESDAAKNRYQPLQACYYDAQGALVSFQINCYAGGFPNLRWNRNGIFKTFVPKQQAPLDTLFNASQHLSHILPLSGQANPTISDEDYIVIVHWSVIMGRQSKRLIRYVQRNLTLAKEARISVYYVNDDFALMYR